MAATTTQSNDEEHRHRAGAHDGVIVSLGRDSYHVEAIVTKSDDEAGAELRLYMLGADESRVIAVGYQRPTAYVVAEGERDAMQINFEARPQDGDAPNTSSLFVGRLPDALIGRNLAVTVPNIVIAEERFRLGFSIAAEGHDQESMPEKVVDESERELYLTPGGLYTQADIEANGNLTASQKFEGFVAAHDLNPQRGDKLCPVTLTKANPQCAWIVGGKTYEFCCPPCVDEFVTLAKTKPDQVKAPDQFVKRESVDGASTR